MEQKGRLKLTCCSCKREFSLLRTIDAGQRPRFLEICPYCGSECVVDLAPWRTEAVEIYKGDAPEGRVLGGVVDLSRVFPTSAPEADAGEGE